jgi:hypothetical protein
MDISTRVILFPTTPLKATNTGTDPNLIKRFDIIVTQARRSIGYIYTYIRDCKLLIEHFRTNTHGQHMQVNLLIE